MSKDKAEKPLTNTQRIEAIEAENAALRARIDRTDRFLKIIVDGYEFAANEVRPLYGFGSIAAVFDAIYAKLKEKL